MQALPQDIAATVAEEDRAAAARFVPASEARCLNLMAQNAELRQQLEDATSLTYSYAKLIGQQREDLRTLRGENATPQRGCEFFSACLGDATALCEIEFTEAEAPIYDPDHPGVGPGHPAEVSLIQILVNGQWCDPTDFMSEAAIEAIEQQVMESRE
jgi:hypothetical protein